MMSRFSSFTLMFSSANLFLIGLAGGASAQTVTAEQRLVVAREDAVRDAMLSLQEGRSSYAKGRYSDAVEQYRKALDTLPKAPATEKQQLFIRESLADALIAKALDYQKVGRHDEGISFIQEAIKLSPSNKRAQQELVHAQDTIRNNPALTPEHVGKVHEVTRLLELAQGHYGLGRYDEAYATYNAVLAIDSYNQAARRGQEQVIQRKMKYYETAQQTARSHHLAEVAKGWEEPVPADNLGIDLNTPRGGEVQMGGERSEQQTAEELDRVRLSKISFDDVPLEEVLDALQAQLYNNEAQIGRVINVTRNFGTVGSQSYEAVRQLRVKLQLSDVSVKDVFDIISRNYGVTYYVTPQGVEFTYSGKDFGPMMERVYTVPPHFFDNAGDVSEGDDDDDDFAAKPSKLAIKRVNPMQHLKAMGIGFPEGSAARYIPSQRTLVVRNTSKNLDDIRDMLDVSPTNTRLVSLSVVAMSMSTNTLEELGFDWFLDFKLDNALYGGGGVAAVNPMAPTVGTLTNTDGLNQVGALRTGSQAIGNNSMERLIQAGSTERFGAAGVSAPAPGIFGFRGSWSAADLAVLMRGVNQRKDVDLLQNPQIIFKAGRDEQVVIACVKEMYYPEEYEAPEIVSSRGGNNNNNNNNTTWVDNPVPKPSHPSSFTFYGISEDNLDGVGTILQIHKAELSEDEQTVEIDMALTINEFEGFINWGSPINQARTNNEQFYFLELTPNYILKPIFKRNYFNNSVVIQSGSVLALGGLQTARKIRYEDKIPILGDLPLVGRLFRSEGEDSEQRVLMYFLKVDVIDPTGVDPRTGVTPSRAMH